MSHVTANIEEVLADLENRMLQLVKWRDETVRQAERIIAKANREFDDVALPLGREINTLRDQAKKLPITRPQKPAVMDGLDDEDQQHFLELRARKTRR